MLSNDTILRKPTITINNVVMLDLTQPSYNWLAPISIAQCVVASDDMVMRPDAMAKLLYGDAGKFDWVCKTNAISNPFTLNGGDIIYVGDPDEITDGLVDANASQQAAAANTGHAPTTSNTAAAAAAASFYFDVTQLSKKDQNRLAFIQQKASKLANAATIPVPPNVASPGNKEITRKDGKVYFGADVVANAALNPMPASKARLKASLLQNKLFPPIT